MMLSATAETEYKPMKEDAMHRIDSTMVILWLLSLVAIGGSAVAYGRQAPSGVVSGNDLAFRVETNHGTTPVGTLLIRVGTEWVPAELSAIQTLQREVQRGRVNR
jgi:hypothetical protein